MGLWVHPCQSRLRLLDHTHLWSIHPRPDWSIHLGCPIRRWLLRPSKLAEHARLLRALHHLLLPRSLGLVQGHLLQQAVDVRQLSDM